MPPEVANAEPGPFTSINYTKADLWTVGTIAYEIFGLPNPFYSQSSESAGLSNKVYQDGDLPPLPEDVPAIVAALVRNILSRNLQKVKNKILKKTKKCELNIFETILFLFQRVNPQTAATVMQLNLWAPNSWLQRNMIFPSSNEVKLNFFFLRN